MRKTKLKHGEKRQEILGAAKRTFLRSGLRGASISAICSEAGISPGHLYHYFDSKEAILEAITEAYLANARERFSRMVEASGVISTIVVEVENTVQLSSSGEQTFFFELIAEANRNPRISEIVRKNTRLMRALFAEFIRMGQERGEVEATLDPETTAFVIVNTINAAKMTRTLDADIAASLMSTMITRFLARQSNPSGNS
ncbi:TetR/AcrR family transcriptional regulator [Rhizobium aegyptiacum]|uniref:TetR/AcrR family transcriptional regulator n=1 Tax=Rhizobium aegyptiacum TaxID=1764550 RepID=UPI0007E55B8B|nr:TetR/AcrR family transcriptional regulator [Rhizobium aegyptiacum]